MHSTVCLYYFVVGAPPPPPQGSTQGGDGWPRPRVRFLHTGNSHQRFYYQSRSLHDTVVARLSPEDIKKAREAKQAQVKPVRQKVCVLLHIRIKGRGTINCYFK